MDKDEVKMNADTEGLQNTLGHFNISQEDMIGLAYLWQINNNVHTRTAYGLDRILQAEKNRKVRIIIDYDEDFPEMVIRVFSRCSQ